MTSLCTRKNLAGFCRTKAIKQSKDNNEIPILYTLWKWNFFILNQVWGINFITEGFADFCSKKVLLLTCNYFYYIDVYENGFFRNIVPTSSFITLILQQLYIVLPPNSWPPNSRIYRFTVFRAIFDLSKKSPSWYCFGCKTTFP